MATGQGVVVATSSRPGALRAARRGLGFFQHAAIERQPVGVVDDFAAHAGAQFRIVEHRRDQHVRLPAHHHTTEIENYVHAFALPDTCEGNHLT